jgi:hypothetical protein
MQNLNQEQIDKELEELKKNIPNYKPITAKGRKEVCDTCPSNVDIGGHVHYCNECGCLLALKIRFPFTSCPLGKW